MEEEIVTQHPNDDNGDALRRLEADGDDLSRARDINFSVVFPSEFAAETFADQFRRQSYQVNVRYSQVKESHPWDVTVVKHMPPSYVGITEFERDLQEAADPLDGYNDGWGCFTEPAKHLH